MVNNPPLRILAEADCQIVMTPDKSSGSNRKIIVNGPVYDLDVTQKKLASYEVKFVTEKTETLCFNNNVDEWELRPFIKALVKKMRKSSERCTTSKRVTKIEYEIDCDAYAMQWNREEKRRSTNGKKFYLKFGFSECDSGCLIVSFK